MATPGQTGLRSAAGNQDVDASDNWRASHSPGRRIIEGMGQGLYIKVTAVEWTLILQADRELVPTL